MKVICSYCKKHMSGKVADKVISHGACKKCAYIGISNIHKKLIQERKVRIIEIKTIERMYLSINTIEHSQELKDIVFQRQIDFIIAIKEHKQEIKKRKKMIKNSYKKYYPITSFGLKIVPIIIIIVCILVILLGGK